MRATHLITAVRPAAALRFRAAPAVCRAFSAAAEKVEFNWEDPLNLECRLTEEERAIRDVARQYAQEKLMPRITMANRNEDHSEIPAIMREMGQLGLLGATISG